ncbi:MAG: glycerophosphodiester phosphodiesterase [Flavobacteriales bacterium]|nr:MAG: glycerophosphodiester phosphodiesterase [Flavobacteriales bacterium]
MRLLLWLPLLMACSVPERGSTRIIGHGGAGTAGSHPLNSGASLAEGLSLGVDGVELDVQLTADGVLVAFHGEDLAEGTPCQGKVNALPWSALQACAVEHGGVHHPVVRVDSFLLGAAAQHPQAEFTLDAKLFAEGDWWAYLEAYTDALARLQADSLLAGRLVVECQVEDFLRLLHGKRPDLPLFYYATDLPSAVPTALALGCTGITIDQARATAEEVQGAHGAGLQVSFFGTNSAWGHRRALSKSPDRLQTDAPQVFAR